MTGVKVALFGTYQNSYDFKNAEARLVKEFNEENSGFGWLKLPFEPLENFQQFVNELNGGPLGAAAPVLVVGIGGSALGLQTLLAALASPSHQRRFFVADNLDLASNEDILGQLPQDRRGMALVVVSKSGRTLETLSNFTFFVNQLGAKASWTEENCPRVFAVTDPDQGALRALVERQGVNALDLPPTVGGRFSVLSSAALPLAMAAGVDGLSLLRGAQRMAQDLLRGGEMAHAARQIGTAILEGLDQGRNITVFMPYGKRLGTLGPWFCQLWGESLGKEGWGPTPQMAVGTIDQHSQLQLYAQGPDDKVYLFVTARGDQEPTIKADKTWDLGLGYLEGMTLSQIQEAEFNGVLASLRKVGRPVVHLQLDGLSAEDYGEILFFLEWLTALVGLAAGVNPFDQPGVEQGKNYALALCGDEKWKAFAPEVRQLITPDWESK